MIRVLLCDDHLIVRQGLRQLLGDCGDVAVVAEADNGPDVLRRVREASGEAPIDVVLLDIAMPGRDGVETLAALRALAAACGRPPPPALAVTANAMTHQLAAYREQGFAAVVPKPLRAEDLALALLASLAPEGGRP
jgi:CheY-like chemotaxis protein